MSPLNSWTIIEQFFTKFGNRHTLICRMSISIVDERLSFQDGTCFHLDSNIQLSLTVFYHVGKMRHFIGC